MLKGVHNELGLTLFDVETKYFRPLSEIKLALETNSGIDDYDYDTIREILKSDSEMQFDLNNKLGE